MCELIEIQYIQLNFEVLNEDRFNETLCFSLNSE